MEVSRIASSPTSLSLINQAVQFYSCFISYSTQDQAFADRLYADLQNGVRCWFAPHDMAPGQKIHEQIDEAIRLHDKLLLILSPHSMNSEWVKTEIRKARKREVADNRRMLFPVSLVGFQPLKEWECFDAEIGKDAAVEIREFFIPDFSSWKTEPQRITKKTLTASSSPFRRMNPNSRPRLIDNASRARRQILAYNRARH